MKKNLGITVLIIAILAGCSVGLRWPKTAQGIMDAAEVSEDTFDKTKWVSFAAIRPNQMTDLKEVTGQSAWSVTVGYFYIRASVKENNTPEFFQIYFSTDYSSSWGFYNKAIDKDGVNLKFVEIDRQVTGYNTVNTDEQFAITFDKAYLEEHKGNNLIIKVYGKRKNFIFYVPQYYLEGVYNYFYKN